MLVFRLICAVLVAWAMNLVLARPEAAALVAELPEMTIIGPIAGAVVGFTVLASRQGWGLVVSISNGIWTGVLAIALSGALYLSYRMYDSISANIIKDFEAFLRVLSYEADPLLEASSDFRLIAMTVAATAVTALVAEALHWCLVRLRRLRGDEEPKKQAKATVAKAGGPLS